MTDRPWIKTVVVATLDGTKRNIDVTDVDGFLAAYAADDNVFWAVELGHVQNVLDALIERVSDLRAELSEAHGSEL